MLKQASLSFLMLSLSLFVCNKVIAQSDIAPPVFSVEVHYDKSFTVSISGRAYCRDSAISTEKDVKNGWGTETITKSELAYTLKIENESGEEVYHKRFCDRTDRTITGFGSGVYNISVKRDRFQNIQECYIQDNKTVYCSDRGDVEASSEFSKPYELFIPDIDFAESSNQTYGCYVTSKDASGNECRVEPQWDYGTEIPSPTVEASYPSSSSGVAQASFVASSGQVTPSAHASGNDLFLQISSLKPNTFVSWNKVSSMALKGNTLKILNSAALNSNLMTTGEASQIVLDFSGISSNVLLDGEIVVVGKPADLIILFGNKHLLCSGCKFSGTSRVVMLSASESSAGYASGLIATALTGSGSLAVDSGGLSAPGVTFLDLVAKNIRLDGDVSLNPKVNVANNKMTIDASGDKSAASGFLRMYLGDFTYQYPEGTFTLPVPNTVSRFYQGQASTIHAGGVSVISRAARGSFISHGAISTVADMTMAGFYQGQVVVPDQSIKFNTVTDVELNGTLQATGEAVIGSGGDIIVLGGAPNQHAVNATDVRMAAEGRVANYASLMGKNVHVSAGEVLNEGDIDASNNIYISAKSGVYNQFGGFLKASKNIDINVPEGFMVNGALRPYKHGKLARVCSPGEQCKVSLGFSSTYTDLGDDPAGTFPLHVTNLAATLLGENIDINAKRFQNVNPYYVLNNGGTIDPAAITLDAQYRDRVVVSSLKNLTITGSSHILNSSAILEAVNGELALNSPVITNERYRIEIGTQPGDTLPDNFCETWNGCVLSTHESATITTTQQYAQYYSPAGRIYSGARAVLNAAFSFVNDLSYFEIHGDVNLHVNHVLQVGLELSHSATIVKTTKHRKKYCKTNVAGACLDWNTKFWRTNEEYARSLQGTSIPALFVVGGYLFGEGAGKFNVTTVVSE